MFYIHMNGTIPNVVVAIKFIILEFLIFVVLI